MDVPFLPAEFHEEDAHGAKERQKPLLVKTTIEMKATKTSTPPLKPAVWDIDQPTIC